LAINGEIGPPNEQSWVMRSVGLSVLVRAAPGVERCA
jgi:hypothetical protein